MKKIGVIGLGNIGARMAGNLIQAGFEVSGFDVVRNASFIEQGGSWSESVGVLCESADVIIHSLPSESALNSTVDHEMSSVRDGQIVIDLSSYPLPVKKNAASRLAEVGVVMLDCEISGLPKMVTDRTAVIFQSGNKAVVDSVENVFAGFAEKYFYLGEFGNATKIKLLANAMVFVHKLMAAEILNLAGKADLDPELVFNVLKNSAAGSTTFTNKAPIMLSREFTDGAGPFRHMFHYLPAASELAGESGAVTPLIKTALEYCLRAESEGRHDEDIAAMIELIESEEVK